MLAETLIGDERHQPSQSRDAGRGLTSCIVGGFALHVVKIVTLSLSSIWATELDVSLPLQMSTNFA